MGRAVSPTLAWALFPSLGVLLSVLTLLIKVSADISGIKSTCKGREKACGEKMVGLPQMRSDLDRIQERGRLYDQVLAPLLATVIHSPEHVMRDMLVEQFVEGTIKPKSIPRLLQLLQQLIDEDATTGRKLAAAMLLKDQIERHKAGDNNGTHNR
jgi:hypothetical protein